jgi:hypothetical protein
MSVIIGSNKVDRKLATTDGVAVVAASDYGVSGFIEDAGATDSTVYKLWLSASSSTINVGASGQSADRTKLIQVGTTDAEIGFFRRKELETLSIYGSVNVDINLAKVVGTL